MRTRDFADPTKFMPMQFTTEVELNAADATLGLMPGDIGRAQVSINDRPFLVRLITHQIISGWPEFPDTLWGAQDGMYRIDWSEYEQIRFWKGAIPMADIAFGSVRDGNLIPLQAPVPLPGNQTLHVAIQNQLARGVNWQTMVVQVIFHGLQERKQTAQGTATEDLEV